MEPDVHIYCVPKLGNSAEEFEDATGSSSEGRRFAIADGATQTSFADRWSQILALEYIMNPPGDEPAPQRWTRWLQPLQEAWSMGIPWDKLPWFAVEKAKTGACTTLLALEFVAGESDANRHARPSLWKRMLGLPPGPAMRWKAEAVGDSCLFHVRNDDLTLAFPLRRPADFTHSPILITTDPRQNALVCDHLKTAEGDCRPGDLFLLMTDALAKWFLGRRVVGEQPWKRLGDLPDDEAFRQFVIEEREAGRMENDDTTLMAIRWPAESEVRA